MEVPADAIGKRARCVCGYRFVLRMATPPADSDPNVPATDDSPESGKNGQVELEFSSMPADSLNESSSRAMGDQGQSPWVAGIGEPVPVEMRSIDLQSAYVAFDRSDDDSGSRYPELVACLNGLMLVSQLVLFVGVCTGLAVTAVGAWESIRLVRAWPVILAGGWGALVIGAAYLARWLIRAIVQFVRVIIDIEQNTRQSARSVNQPSTVPRLGGNLRRSS